ncbi:MAG: response regulator [Deltaproteobacteria bacterium]|nr:response regulator [Deltaproteobacteria bacterium]
MAKRILFFEQDKDFAQEIKAGFENLGAIVDLVDDGPSGLEHAAATMPDLILLTIELPGMNGFLVCKKIKKNTGLKDIPLVILSSEASAETFEQHSRLRTHAQKYLHKPISFDQVLESAKELIELEEGAKEYHEEDIEEIIEVDDEIVLTSEDGASESEIIAEEATYLVEDADQFANDAFESLMTGVEQQGEKPEKNEPEPMIEPEPEMISEPEPEPEPQLAFDSSRESASENEMLRREVGEAEQTIIRLQKELQAERSAASLKKGAGTNRDREFLDIKEKLNRKDHEILELKDQLSSRDKQLLEARDENLKLAREIADLRDNVTVLEADLARERDRGRILASDKDLANKRFDEMKTRLERIESKSRELEAELDRAEEKTGEKIKQMEAERQSALETERENHEEALRALRQELEEKHAQEISESKRQNATEMEQLARAAFEAGQKLEALKGKIHRIEDEKRNLEESLAEVADERDSKADELTNARSSIGILENNNDELQKRVDALNNKLDQAMRKIESDEELLKRVRQAMAIGIGLLEEQKQNQIGN